MKVGVRVVMKPDFAALHRVANYDRSEKSIGTIPINADMFNVELILSNIFI